MAALRGLSRILACHRKTRSAAIPKMGGWRGLLAAVDWWITMLHVMIALGGTCVCKCSVVRELFVDNSMGIHKDIGKVEVLGLRITCGGLMQTPVQQVASGR
ncbi:hypothetical protein NL676_014425 [Syzygium grande]|nr:hypothetical protein NL676_014425 [Syzygium grande]